MSLRIKNIVFIIGLFFIANILNGQDHSKYAHSVYWNAGQIAGFPSSITFGYEMELAENIFIDLEAGMFFYAYDFYEGEREGYKIEPGLKMYLNKHISLTPKLQYKKSSHTETSFVGRFNFQYFENLEYTIDRTVKGLICDFGVHGDFSSSRLGWEFVLGFGIGSINVDIKNLPEDARLDDTGFALFRRDGDYGVPLFRYGFKVKYYLVKKNEPISKTEI